MGSGEGEEMDEELGIFYKPPLHCPLLIYIAYMLRAAQPLIGIARAATRRSEAARLIVRRLLEFFSLKRGGGSIKRALYSIL